MRSQHEQSPGASHRRLGLFAMIGAAPRETLMKSSVVTPLGISIVCALAGPVSALAQDSNAGRNLAANCFTCHGTGGNSVGGVPPSLAARDATELFQAMKDFQTGKRPATIMHQQAKGYTDSQLQLIAAYFAGLKPTTPRLPSK